MVFAVNLAGLLVRGGIVAGLVAGISSCSSSHRDPATDATVDAADAGDEGSAALTCQAIRLCFAAGSSAEACSARGTAQARSAFQALLDCLADPCPGLVPACVCREECEQPDGFCLDQTDACLATSGTTVDAVCGQYCGG